ncbi:hemerythrin domain-containing protein [Streptomyces sp. BHT-5-2]|uniref:hemerythrin domain-containing protein n=1 Tax=Streptomyces sp. BHT-5-2 TaxID=2866715 RepID=UPI001C8ED8AF|nr:hemerythrin domain-containing protein [Streptomyces sp. BHT-5-2]QZL04817.1 hemerythrin domain-containing protein [Streptomyces sp. BHT-5-2]
MSHTMHQSELTWELKRDHRTIQALLDRICSAGAGSLEQERLVRHTAAEFERHAVAERRFLLPMVRCGMRGGDALAGRLEAGYPDVLGALDQATSASFRDPGFEGKVQDLTAAFDRHVRLCERELFPRVCRTCPETELTRLGSEFHRHAHRHHADIA